MGARLSTSQKDAVHKVVGLLALEDVSVNKKELKILVRWVFSNFPEVSLENFRSHKFWREVQLKLEEKLKAGDTSCSRLLHWASQIRTILEKYKDKEKRKNPPARPLPPSYPNPACPKSVPHPSTLQKPQSLRVAAPDSTGQGVHLSPGPSQGAGPLSRDSPWARTAASLPYNPFSQTTVLPVPDPVTPPVVQPTFPFSQNGAHHQHGGEHMVWWRQNPSSSQDSTLLSSNPFRSCDPAPDFPTPFGAPPASPVPPQVPPPPPVPPRDIIPKTEYPPNSSPALFSHDVSNHTPQLPVSHAPASCSHDSAMFSHLPNSKTIREPNPLRQVQVKGNKEKEQKPTDNITVAPVSYYPTIDGSTTTQWAPVPHHTIRELCKAQKEFGRENEYFRGLLRATIIETIVTPTDLRSLFSCLLDPTNFSIWERGWEKRIVEMLPTIWADPMTATDSEGETISKDHMLGKDRWADGHVAAAEIPFAVLRKTAKAAEAAFLSLRSTAVLTPFSQIYQYDNEPFTAFVERMRKAIEQQVLEEAARAPLIKELVLTHANNVCKPILLSLPVNPPPTLQDMLEACEIKAPVFSAMSSISAKSAPRKVAVLDQVLEDPEDLAIAASSITAPTLGGKKREMSPCHLCGKVGHWMPDCPLRADFYNFKKLQRLDGDSKESAQQKNL
ncbi:uncharacterized protein GJ701_003456 [Geothlypis trichas]